MELDFIGRYENLQHDLCVCLNKIFKNKNEYCDYVTKIDLNSMSYNKSKHKRYTEYYDEETIAIVTEKLSIDINYFNYKFGE